MQKTLLTTCLAFALCGPLYADEGQDYNTQTLTGSALGALSGGLVAGPPGAVAGFVVGGLFGNLERQRTRLESASRQIAQLEQTRLQERQSALDETHQLQTRLDRVSGNFSFCMRFRSGSAEIEPFLLPHLEAMGRMLNAFPELHVEVLAGADRRGSEEFNLTLTRQRAEQVRQALVAAGVEAGRIHLRNTGEQLARYQEDDPEGLDFDRYVVLRLLAGGIS